MTWNKKERKRKKKEIVFISYLNWTLKKEKKLFKYHSVDLINTNRTYIYIYCFYPYGYVQ